MRPTLLIPDTAVEIVTGLSPRDAVVSAGTHKVMAGKRLRVVESPETTPAAGEPSPAPDRGRRG